MLMRRNDSTAEANGRRENHYDVMHLRLWILDAARGRLDIVPQDWFNEGADDEPLALHRQVASVRRRDVTCALI
jgi:hypothetical protein